MKTNVISGLIICSLALALHAANTLPLAGEWRFRLDPDDAGMAATWYNAALPNRIKLPGTLPAQGIGNAVTLDTPWIGRIVDRSFFTAPEYEVYRQPGNIKIPFWLTPDTYYAGAAWYQRDIEIPAAWQGKCVTLSLERPHWETRVWVDGQSLGANNSLAVPHTYDLGLLTPGHHVLTIRVDNRMIIDIGENSHSVSDHTQGNWNGMVGELALHATPPVWINTIQVYPDRALRHARVAVTLGNLTGKAGKGMLHFSVVDAKSLDASHSAHAPISVTWDASGGQAEFEVVPHSARPWDEFAPQLYRLTLELANLDHPNEGTHSRRVTFGLRDFVAQGTQFAINGRPLFIRGTLDCCTYPKTGHPPTDVAEWRRIIGVAKAHGLNLIRFHSWCPPEAAFQAADELGFYLHVEVPTWANDSTTLGDGKPIDGWIDVETERILNVYGNHPSFVLMACGNEPGGRNQKTFLATWVTRYKALDPRRLFTSAAAWPEIPENQWHCLPGPRIQGWASGLKSIINSQPPSTAFDFRDFIAKRHVPVVSHEIGQWCVYPNFDEVSKYTGYLKPKNFEIFRDQLAARGLLDQARDFLLASGKLQALCYKADIEAALRTPGMAGFELLDLHDFTGQGTALIGVLDPFWEEKGYITPIEYRRFCNATVPLVRLTKRVFTTDETLEAELEIAHFGPQPLTDAQIEWSLRGSDGQPVAHGTLPPQTIPLDNGHRLGSVRIDLSAASIRAPAQYRLTVGVQGTMIENDWHVWVYPTRHDAPSGAHVTIAHDWDDASRTALQAGNRVVLFLPPQRVRQAANTNEAVVLGFSSIFWNTAWTRRQPPTTLGILCDPKHPALATFPTEFHSDWQWWYLVTHAAPMILDDLPRDVKPIVQVIDDWVTAHKLALVFEARVGKGRLLVCSITLDGDTDTNPVSRQFRASLLAYAASEAFQPSIDLTTTDIDHLVNKQ